MSRQPNHGLAACSSGLTGEGFICFLNADGQPSADDINLFRRLILCLDEGGFDADAAVPQNRKEWACGAAGSALPWHSDTHGKPQQIQGVVGYDNPSKALKSIGCPRLWTREWTLQRGAWRPDQVVGNQITFVLLGLILLAV